MKCGLLTWLASWLITIPLYSQFTDDFSDGNLDGWQGDVSHFVITSGAQLQLSAPEGSGQAWLYTPVLMTDSMTWDIYLKMDFAPSTSNQLRIYLGLTDPDYATASGYYIEIGASGDMDALDLKYLQSGTDEIIASSAPGLVANEPVELRVRIIKRSNGMWEVYQIEDIVPELLFTVNHDIMALSSLSWFGLQCRFTDTRRDKFFFDDIQVNPLFADTLSPVWTSLDVISDRTLSLLFNEILDAASAEDLLHYHLLPDAVQPTVATLIQNQVHLEFATPFTSQLEYSLTVEGIKDVAGNTMTADMKNFTFYSISQAGPDELLITEIMADPTPVIGLPDAEFLELYNATSGIFQLSDYTLTIGTSERVLPDYMLLGGEYVILCSEENKGLLDPYGAVIPVPSMPTLTNGGTRILVKNQGDEIIHEVNYSISWYQDPDKSDGGWSIEMKNAKHICTIQNNWAAAGNLLGGTPGSENSQWSTSEDLEGPGFISLNLPTPAIIHLRFDEKLNAELMENPDAFVIVPDVVVTSVSLLDPQTLEIRMAAPLQQGIVYQLMPFEGYDCLGNPSSIQTPIRFGLLADAEPGDLFINEVLFNPATGGSRFIEITNTSSKFISLGTLAVGRITSSDQNIYATGLSEIIGPGDIVAFTPDRNDILSRYHVAAPHKLYETSLPSWDDSHDNVSLIAAGTIIDSFTYQSGWHHPVISDQNGVSLERISSNAPSIHPSTWHSASSISGYGTPTGPNSQELQVSGEPMEPYTVINSTFSPDGDGYKDFLALDFQLSNGDLTGSIWVYDLEGHEIALLASNETLGTSAIIQWDGRDTAGRLADMGMYVIFIQLWNTDGGVREYKTTCALVKR